MKLKIQAGTTSRIIRVFIRDSSSTTGAGLTGLVHNSAGLTAYYSRVGDSGASVISLATATVGSWTSGGFKEVDSTNMPGVYELHLPDVSIAAGATAVHVLLKGAANMVPTPIEIELDTINYQASSGILPVDLQTIKTQSVTCAGGVTVPAAILASTTNITAGTISTVSGDVNGNIAGNLSGSVGSVTGSVGSVTGSVGSVVGSVGGSVAGSVGSVTGAVGSVVGGVGGDVSGKVLGNGAGAIAGDGVRAASVTGAVGSVTGSVGSVVGAVGSVATGVTIAGTLGTLDAIWVKIKAWLGAIAGKTTDLVTLAEIQTTNAGVNYNNTTDSLEAIRDRGDAAWTTGSGGGGGGDCPTEEEIADAVVAALSGRQIRVDSPFAAGGPLTVYTGDDHAGDQALTATITNRTDLVGLVPVLYLESSETVSVDAPAVVSATQTIVFNDLLSIETSRLSYGLSPDGAKGKYQIKFVDGDGHVITKIDGVLFVKRGLENS